MNLPAGPVLALCLLAGVVASPVRAQTIIPVGGGLNFPGGVAVDAGGDVFVADSFNMLVKEIPAAEGRGVVRSLGTPAALAIGGLAPDGKGNVFVTDLATDTVGEILATGGYRTIAGGFSQPRGLVLDSSGNLFVADTGNNAVKEIPAAGGYAAVDTVATGLPAPAALAFDVHANLFVAVQDGASELPAAGGYGTVIPLVTGFPFAIGIAVDIADDLYLSNGATYLFQATHGYAGPIKLEVVGQTSGIATYEGANLYFFVAESGARTVNQAFVSPDGTISPAEIIGAGVTFNGPTSLGVDPHGNLYIADTGSNAIMEFPLEGNAYVTDNTVPNFLGRPGAVAVDGNGDVFVADVFRNAVKEFPAAGNYLTVNAIGSGFGEPIALAADAAGNVFVVDAGDDTIKEVLAAGGYATVQTIASVEPAFGNAVGIAVDAAGNLFVANGSAQGITEYLAEDGYAQTKTIGAGFGTFSGIAVDRADNLFVIGNGVQELPAAGGYSTITTIMPVGNPFDAPTALAVDGSGDIFLAEVERTALTEIVGAGSPLLASTLPGSRSPQLGAPATIFATMLNTGATALEGCGIALPSDAPFGLTLSYQATDPTTNAPTGAPDTPVTIAGGNGSRTFVLAFQSPYPFTAPGLPLVFSCTGAVPAIIIPGVDTVDLAMSGTPFPDFVVLAATSSNNGIIVIPITDAGAFAVATTDLGTTDPITVSVDTGDVILPVTLTICQTNPGSGQCLGTPAASVPVDYGGGPAPTFTIFLQSSGPIPLAPALSRIFVRFEDGAGGLHGSTSVAVQGF
jgi:sugar lactone lactonase YvrE